MFFPVVVVLAVFLFVRRRRKELNTAVCNSCGWRGPKAVWDAGSGCPQCGGATQAPLPPLFGRAGFPHWFNVLNLVALAPIIPYPAVLLATVMLSDSGQHMETVIPLIILAAVYPLILLLVRRYSYSLYDRNKALAIALPLIPTALVVWFIMLTFRSHALGF